jgi:hypothetical protein
MPAHGRRLGEAEVRTDAGVFDGITTASTGQSLSAGSCAARAQRGPTDRARPGVLCRHAWLSPLARGARAVAMRTAAVAPFSGPLYVSRRKPTGP